MNADRKTMTMVKTPTRVLFSLDWTILLERVCRGTGKSWECGGNHQQENINYEWVCSPDLMVNLHGPVREEKNSGFQIKTKKKKTHAKTAVDSGDKHDGHEDDETADEEAHYHTGTTGRKRDVIKYT